MVRSSGMFVVLFAVAHVGGFATIALGETISPSADAYVLEQNVGANYGATATLQLKAWSATAGAARKVWMRFDLSSVEVPGTTISDATLNLPFVESNAGTLANAALTFNYNVYGLNDGASGENWAENAITWSNAPGNDKTSDSAVLASATSLLGTFTVTGKGAGSTFTVAGPSIVDFLKADTDGKATFIVVQATDQGPMGESNNYVHTIGSKEGNVAHATLDVVTIAVPEPNSCLVLALGAFGLTAYAWRKRR